MKINNKIQKNVFLILGLFFLTEVSGQVLTPNGYSGVGLFPSASTLPLGSAVISYSNAIPGIERNRGTNVQLGFGLMDNFEFTGRLATQSNTCNLFTTKCPEGTIRDVSASAKLKLPVDYLKKYDTELAIGVTDYGGAATYFRNTYLVGTKKWEAITASIGFAQKNSVTAPLNGAFSSVQWSPSEKFTVALQNNQKKNILNAGYTQQINESIFVNFSANKNISKDASVPDNWLSLSLMMPLGGKSSASKKSDNKEIKKLNVIDKSELINALESRGFVAAILQDSREKIVLTLSTESYSWNVLDALGVALGVVAGVYENEHDTKEIELLFHYRGIPMLRLVADSKCARGWLESNLPCEKIQLTSMLTENAIDANREVLADLAMNNWKFLPVISLSPAVTSVVGSEYGSFDADLGLNVTTALPLWRGGWIESNRLEPTGLNTKNYEKGGWYYIYRLKPAITRTMIHHVETFPSLNTTAKLSVGNAYTVWSGNQIETSTVLSDDRNRFGTVLGKFKKDPSWADPSTTKEYFLMNYRYVPDRAHKTSSEITYGKYWGGDVGFGIQQKFWFDDTSLNLYFRRTKTESQPNLASFAGVQISLPLGPRQAFTKSNLTIRGAGQWTYGLESKVLEKDNKIMGGLGEVPRMGDSLPQILNRDRNTTAYYEKEIARIREAYLKLY